MYVPTLRSGSRAVFVTTNVLEEVIMCSYLVAMFGIGMQELIVILLILLLLFGATKLPQIARSLGKSIKEFKKGSKEAEEEPEKDEKK